MDRQKSNTDDLSNLSKPVYAPRKQRQRPPDKNQGDLFAERMPSVADSHKASGDVPAAEAARSAASCSEHRTAAAAGGDGPLYLSNGHCCDEGEREEFPFDRSQVHGAEDLGRDIGSVFRLRPCRCRRWFCRYCGPRQGWHLRQRLQRRLAEFQDVFGITLTLHGALFNSPEHGWSYVMENRLLSRLVRDLDARKHLHSKDYFWSVEFQGATEQAHWHMLVNAERIPYAELVEIWSRFRPSFAPALDEPMTAENYHGRAPAFGSVAFSPPRDRAKAAWYATKYLTKYPQAGYPDWVLDRAGRMPRFGHSHRFFPPGSKHDPMCFCPVCCGEAEPLPASKKPKKKTEEKKPSRPRDTKTTIRERLEQCGNSCSIVEVRRIELPDGTVVDGRAKFEGKLQLPIADACEHFGVSADAYWELDLRGEEVTELEELSGQRPPSERAT